MTLRRTILWLFTILLMAAVGGGGYGWWLWDQRDLLLEATLHEKLPEFLPGWDVKIGRVHFDWHRRIHVHDVTLMVGDPPKPFVTLPELLITVDRQQLTQNQQIVVQKLKLMSPVVELSRDASGKWNWSDLPPLKRKERGSPEIEIEKGTVRVRFHGEESASPTVLTFRQIETKLVPSGRRAYIVKGATHIHQAGLLAFDGKVDIDEKTWSVDGSLRDVVTNGDLLNLAAGISPELRRNLGRIEAALEKVRVALNEDTDAEPKQAFAWNEPRRQPQFLLTNSTREKEPGDDIPDFGVAATMSLGFHVECPDPAAPPQFCLNVGLRDGRVRNDVLPFPLEDVEGEIYWDNKRIEIRRISGQNGLTRMAFGGRLERVEGGSPGAFGLRIENLQLDERLRERLPPAARRVYDSLNPNGPIDLECTVRYDGVSKWKPENLLATAKGCQITHAKFPYLVTDVIGTVTQKGEDLELLFEGRAGDRPVLVQGTVHNPGPAAETAFDVTVRQAPLNEELIAACPPQVQDPLRTLNLRGYADAEVRLYRPPGLGQKFEWQLSSQVSRASLQYQHFPYRLHNLSGRVLFSSEDGIWSFHDMKANHGAAKLAGSGEFHKKPGDPGHLALTIAAAEVPLDQQLQIALPETVRKIWDDLSLTGTLRRVKTTIDWTPGEKPEIALPEIQISRGSLMLSSFPYQIDQVEAQASWSDSKLEITSFTGRHDETPIVAHGFCETLPDGDWRMRLTDLTVTNASMDQSLRRALPATLLNLVDQAEFQGQFSLSGMAEFRGTGRPGDPVTAAWDVKTFLPGNHLNAGVELKNVQGAVTSAGTWNGRIADMNGQLSLETITVLGHVIDEVKGPFRFRDHQLVLGSSDALLPDRRPREERPVPLQQRVTGKAIGGVITMDTSAAFHETPVWTSKITLTQGRLEDYAARYMPGTNNLRGVMTGWIDLQGRGTSTRQMTGRGSLQISPAALYELPVMVQMFRVMSATSQDRTAFKYAHTDFTLEKNQFQFQVIDLVGDTMSLRGRGTAGLDGRLSLDFFSMMPRSRIAIPGLDFLVGEATKGWVGVEVRGQVSAPIAKVKPVPQVDDALKQFLRAFNPRSQAPMVGPPNAGGN